MDSYNSPRITRSARKRATTALLPDSPDVPQTMPPPKRGDTPPRRHQPHPDATPIPTKPLHSTTTSSFAQGPRAAPHNSRRAMLMQPVAESTVQTCTISSWTNVPKSYEGVSPSRARRVASPRQATTGKSRPQGNRLSSPLFLLAILLLCGAALRGAWTRWRRDALHKRRLHEPPITAQDKVPLLAPEIVSQLYGRVEAAERRARDEVASLSAELEGRAAAEGARLTALMGRIEAQDLLAKEVSEGLARLEGVHASSVATAQAQSQDTETRVVADVTAPLVARVRRLEDGVASLRRDATGPVNWAQAALGAAVVRSHTAAPLHDDDWFEKAARFFGSFQSAGRYNGLTSPASKPASVVLESRTLTAGQCFAFSTPGNVTIELPREVLVSRVTVEHVEKEATPTPKSAPRLIEVYGEARPTSALLEGLVASAGKPQVQLGAFEFSYPNTTLGDFATVTNEFPVWRITFSFLENWGADYTCVYRLRVFGDPVISPA